MLATPLSPNCSATAAVMSTLELYSLPESIIWKTFHGFVEKIESPN